MKISRELAYSKLIEAATLIDDSVHLIRGKKIKDNLLQALEALRCIDNYVKNSIEY